MKKTSLLMGSIAFHKCGNTNTWVGKTLNSCNSSWMPITNHSYTTVVLPLFFFKTTLTNQNYINEELKH